MYKRQLPDYSNLLSITDDCSIASLVQYPAAGTILSNEGSVTINFHATDVNGNMSTCSFQVNKVDATAPVVSCLSDTSITLNSNCDYVMGDFTSLVTASDNCQIQSITQSPTPGTVLSGQATQVVQITVEDVSSNQQSCSFNLQLIDATGPSIICASDTTVTSSCGLANITLDPPTATDACGGNLTFTNDYGSTTFTTGTTVVTWTATDPAGNITTCRQTVRVLVPEIALYGHCLLYTSPSPRD